MTVSTGRDGKADRNVFPVSNPGQRNGRRAPVPSGPRSSQSLELLTKVRCGQNVHGFASVGIGLYCRALDRRTRRVECREIIVFG